MFLEIRHDAKDISNDRSFLIKDTRSKIETELGVKHDNGGAYCLNGIVQSRKLEVLFSVVFCFVVCVIPYKRLSWVCRAPALKRCE